MHFFPQVVKTSSPHFLVIILVGCILQYCEVSCTKSNRRNWQLSRFIMFLFLKKMAFEACNCEESQKGETFRPNEGIPSDQSKRCAWIYSCLDVSIANHDSSLCRWYSSESVCKIYVELSEPFTGSSSKKTIVESNYRKIPKISPGAYIFQSPFLRGLFSEWLMYGRKFAFQNRLG